VDVEIFLGKYSLSVNTLKIAKNQAVSQVNDE
jgi:hypothetical protein